MAHDTGEHTPHRSDAGTDIDTTTAKKRPKIVANPNEGFGKIPGWRQAFPVIIPIICIIIGLMTMNKGCGIGCSKEENSGSNPSGIRSPQQHVNNIDDSGTPSWYIQKTISDGQKKLLK